GAPPRQPALLRGLLFDFALFGLRCLAHRTTSRKQRAIELALEGDRDAAGHQYVVIAQPFDGERAALQDDVSPARPQAAPARRDHGRTGTRAAGKRDACAALPDAQTQP